MGEERELYEIRHLMECAIPILDRIAMALEKLAPHSSERERIALRLWETLDVEVEASFRHADRWIEERDRQRVQQAEQGRVK